MDVTVEPLTDDLSNSIVDRCTWLPILPLSHCKIHPSGMNLPVSYGKYAHTILDMEVKEDDTWVISFPRCGTTWTQEMVWLLKNNLNFKRAKEIYLHDRYKFLEFDPMFDLSPNFAEDIKKIGSPRFIKTHLRKQLLPKQLWTIKPKIIYVFRNPKDAAISLYHHYRLWNSYTGSLDLFLKAFVNDKVMCTPFWEGVLEFWEMRDELNILFITYEEMKRDLRAVIKKTSNFFGLHYNKDELAELEDHLSFSSMKRNPSVNLDKMLNDFGLNKNNSSHIREGASGGWREEFSPEMVKMFDEWTTKHLVGTDFPRDDL